MSMTEEEWLACTDLPRLIKSQRRAGKDRQLRLFACACARRVWGRLDGTARDAIATAERVADGQASASDLGAIYHAALEAWRDVGHAWAGIVATGLAVANEEPSKAALYASTAAPDVNAPSGTPARKKAMAAERQVLLALFHDVIGNPFRPVVVCADWRTPTLDSLAQAGYAERDRSSGQLDPIRLAILADALEDAGCTDAAILAHLRSPGPHMRGCWALDLVLGRS
jgi:hypothetical protein